MKICFYTDYTMSGMTGGIGRATTVLTDYFRHHFKWQVFSIFAFQADSSCILTETDGAIQLRLHDRLGIRRLSANYYKAVQFIKQNQIEIVIIQTSMDVVARLRKALDREGLQHVQVISVLHYSPGTDEFPISVSALYSDLKKGKKVIKNIAKGLTAPLFNMWEHRATVSAYRSAYKYGKRVFVLSDSYIPAYCQFAGLREQDKLVAIPNTIPFSYDMNENELLGKQKTALVVGRMVDFPKRISTILKMWKEIEMSPTGQDWNLEIVGEGPDLNTFKTLASSLKLERCKFEGRQNPLEYYKKASIFFMASEFEGFPMTLVEAQQMGCIPIAFDSFSSLKEVITNNRNGITIKNDDIQGYVQSAISIMSNPQIRLEIAKNAIESCKVFSQEAICNRWKSELEKIKGL